MFPNSILFQCDPGFILSGSTKRTCQANRTWSGSPTICRGRLKPTVARHEMVHLHVLFCHLFLAVDCGHLAAPMNGSSSADSTVFPNSVLFNCDPGFILNGSSARTCQSNGTWSGLSTVCVGRFEVS